MIPKIIHQTNGEVTDVVLASQKSIEATHPDWEYIYWTDEDIDVFVKDNFSLDFYAYWAATVGIRKWDTARYLLVGKLGGMYADLDVLFYKSMNDIIDFDKELVFRSPVKKKRKNGDITGIHNHFFVSAPASGFWKHMLDNIVERPARSVHRHTGGLQLGHSLQEYLDLNPDFIDKIQFLDDNYVINKNFKHQVSVENFDADKVYMEHLLMKTWRR